jgi:hypothetical protein
MCQRPQIPRRPGEACTSVLVCVETTPRSVETVRAVANPTWKLISSPYGAMSVGCCIKTYSASPDFTSPDHQCSLKIDWSSPLLHVISRASYNEITLFSYQILVPTHNHHVVQREERQRRLPREVCTCHRKGRLLWCLREDRPKGNRPCEEARSMDHAHVVVHVLA